MDPGLKELLGWSRLELLGQPLSTVFPGGLPGLPWGGPAPSPMDRQPLRVSAPRRDGRPREVEVRLSPWLLKRARQGTRPADTETAWRLEKAQRQSHKLARMMDEQLDVSRLAEGRLRLELCDVDLVRVVREVLERFHAGGPPEAPAGEHRRRGVVDRWEGGGDMTQAASGVGVARVEVEVTISAPRERVWRALVEEPGRWWPKDFYVGQTPKGFVIEARPGGRVYEDWGNEAGALWYTVLVVEPPAVLELAGHLTPAFGGPATTTVRLTLKEEGDATVVRVEDAIFGRVDENTSPRLREGWRTLMGSKGLKAYVENQTP